MTCMREIRSVDIANLSDYICPRNHAKLWLDGSKSLLLSEDGKVRYPIRNGMHCFLRYSPIENESMEQELLRVNQIAKSEGWREALEDVYGKESPIYRYVTEERRANFLDLLPLKSDSVVLEIGPGLGQFTELIAKRSGLVHALEVVLGQAEFVAERARQEGAQNVVVACGGDDCRLPYPDMKFDVIIVNLVLEWCGARNMDETPLNAQRTFLRESFRALKAGGVLYVATKNRFALRFLTGRPDEHAHNMRFGSALPRWLLRTFLKLRGKQEPEGLLHSYAGLKALLNQAGFGRIKTFWAIPEMRYPEHYVATDSASIRKARRTTDLVQGDTRRTKFLMPLIPAPLVKFFTPGLAFIAEK